MLPLRAELFRCVSWTFITERGHVCSDRCVYKVNIDIFDIHTAKVSSSYAPVRQIVN